MNPKLKKEKLLTNVPLHLPHHHLMKIPVTESCGVPWTG
jgi:hypothetical protein